MNDWWEKLRKAIDFDEVTRAPVNATSAMATTMLKAHDRGEI